MVKSVVSLQVIVVVHFSPEGKSVVNNRCSSSCYSVFPRTQCSKLVTYSNLFAVSKHNSDKHITQIFLRHDPIKTIDILLVSADDYLPLIFTIYKKGNNNFDFLFAFCDKEAFRNRFGS